MNVNLMDLLPPIYECNSTMEELQNILSDKVNGFENGLSETIDECFIETASALLARYEKIYGIPTDISKSDIFRREILKAKLRGVGTVTKQLIVDTAASYSNGSVEVTEYPETYCFTVKFIGALGIPANLAGLTNTINEIKPAHLSFSYIYTYITWAKVEIYSHTWATWEEKKLRWAQFETYKE